MKKELKDELISKKTAMLAKEKGFDIRTSDFFCNDKELNEINFLQYREDDDFFYRPTQSLLQRWLRLEFNCIIEIIYQYSPIDTNGKILYVSTVDYYGKDFENDLSDEPDYQSTFYEKYEKALEVGLYEALKMI
ncbi:hypothetical protein M0Q50_03430 [bacterium]|jgi:hypothetical protein|nr:hypothetical protein [bacterium]